MVTQYFKLDYTYNWWSGDDVQETHEIVKGFF